MWTLAEPWWELLLRGSLVYLVLLVLFRFSGKRQAGQMTPFDLLLLLIISNAVQNAMVGEDTSVVGGLLVAVVLIAWNQLLGWLTSRSKRIENLLEGRPVVLVHNGHVFEDELKRNRMSIEELRGALRSEGCFDLDHVAFAILETNGHVSVKTRSAA